MIGVGFETYNIWCDKRCAACNCRDSRHSIFIYFIIIDSEMSANDIKKDY